MKRIGIGWFIVMVLILSCGKKSGSGQIEVEPDEVRLGRLIAGKSVERKVVIKNVGSGELLVKGVRSNCECVVIDAYPSEIVPNGVDTLRFRFIAPDFKGESKKSIFIETTDKAKPLFTLNIYAFIVPSYMDSTLAVLNFQADDHKLGYELAVAVTERAKMFSQFRVVPSDELVDSILADPDYRKIETDKIIRKWGESLGIRYVITGQVKESQKDGKVTVMLVFIDSFFDHPIIRRIEGKKESIKDTVVAEFALTMENIEKVEREVYLQTIQSKWLKKRSELVGKPAPSFRLKDIKGKDVTLDQYRGKVIILHFFSIDCEACVEELEWMKVNSEKPGCNVIGLSVDSGKEKDLMRFIDAHSIRYPIVVISERDSSFLNAYYNNVTPQTVIIAKNGSVRESVIGFSEGLKNNLNKLIDELIKE